MKRSSWKLPFISSSLKKKRTVDFDINRTLTLWFRNSIIPPYLIGRRIRVYNGIWFLTQTITSEMVGTKFGDYSITKRFDTQLRSRMKTKKKLRNANGSFS